MGRTEPGDRGPAALSGRGIVITRPAAQCERLARLVEAAGGIPIVFPLIEIRPVADAAAAREQLAQIADYDLVVFISANAVEYGLALVPGGASRPPALRIAAVGSGTARALRSHGIANVLLPAERFDSEGLLALPELKTVDGRRVLIVRGVGGRELLGETLTARGARVAYAECYERMPPSAGGDMLLDAWRGRRLHAITITSSEALRNLNALLSAEGRDYLHATPLFVTHERMRETALALGVHDVVMAEPGDESLGAALVDYFSARG